MNTKYVAPEFEKSAFQCPHCNIFAYQGWSSLAQDDISQIKPKNQIGDIESATCSHCKKPSLWLHFEKSKSTRL